MGTKLLSDNSSTVTLSSVSNYNTVHLNLTVAATQITSMSSSIVDNLTVTVASSLDRNDPFNTTATTTTTTTTEQIFTNSSCGSDAQKSDIIDSNIVQAIFCVLYSSIFILGIFGNVLVCYVVIRNKAMHTVTNIFIANLAVSDILLVVLAVPFTPLYTFLGRWVFGRLFCHIVPYAQGCSVYISTLTLSAIAIDRFFVIIYPFKPRMQLLTCFCIVFSIWFFALLVTFPYGLFVRIVDYKGTRYCEEHWPSELLRKIFSSATTMLQFVIPFCVISIAYIVVSVKLNARAQKKVGSQTTKKEIVDRDRKKRTNRMLIAMVAIFGVSWLPLNVVNTMNDFEPDINCWQYYNVLFFIAHLTAMSSTCYNPFLYAWLNENFRKEFKQVLPCFDPSRGRENGNGGARTYRERTCNGNNDTIQESLLPSACNKPIEIKPRAPNKEAGMRASFKAPSSFNKATTTSIETNDTILLSEVSPPPIQYLQTIMLSSGVLETPFEDPPSSTRVLGNGDMDPVFLSTSLSSNLLLDITHMSVETTH